MTDPSFEELRDELRELVVVTRHGEPTQQQIERLDELVRSDPEARDLYVQLIDDEMSLQLLAGVTACICLASNPSLAQTTRPSWTPVRPARTEPLSPGVSVPIRNPDSTQFRPRHQMESSLLVPQEAHRRSGIPTPRSNPRSRRRLSLLRI